MKGSSAWHEDVLAFADGWLYLQGSRLCNQRSTVKEHQGHSHIDQLLCELRNANSLCIMAPAASRPAALLQQVSQALCHAAPGIL